MNNPTWTVRSLLGGQRAETDPLQRRYLLTARMQVTILALVLLGLVVVIVNPGSAPRRGIYESLIPGLGILVIAALVVGRFGRHRASAWLTVATVVAAPWGSLLLDPHVLSGDLVPLSYVGISVMVSSMLLTTRATIALAVTQGVALLTVALASPMTGLNWASLLMLVFCVSLLAVLYSYVTRRDLDQISAQNLQLQDSRARLEQKLIRDPLTSLYNWRYLEQVLERELAPTDREPHPSGLVILDVDHFKAVNDTLGHAARDEVLRRVGRLLREGIGSGDVACRFGGDEFVLLLPGAGQRESKDVAASLLADIRGLDAPGGAGGYGFITASAGVASFPANGSTGVELFRAADLALYAAKKGGRDRIAVADGGA